MWGASFSPWNMKTLKGEPKPLPLTTANVIAIYSQDI